MNWMLLSIAFIFLRMLRLFAFILNSQTSWISLPLHLGPRILDSV